MFLSWLVQGKVPDWAQQARSREVLETSGQRLVAMLPDNPEGLLKQFRKPSPTPIPAPTSRPRATRRPSGAPMRARRRPVADAPPDPTGDRPAPGAGVPGAGAAFLALAPPRLTIT